MKTIIVLMLFLQGIVYGQFDITSINIKSDYHILDGAAYVFPSELYHYNGDTLVIRTMVDSQWYYMDLVVDSVFIKDDDVKVYISIPGEGEDNAGCCILTIFNDREFLYTDFLDHRIYYVGYDQELKDAK